MAVKNIVYLGLLFGIIATLISHLSKGFQKRGIEIFDRDKPFKEKGKKPLIYIIGLILNYSIVIWQIIALQFSSAAVFTSVFGLGLIVILVYSHYVLHEKITRKELEGSILIIFGTTFIGIIQLFEPINAEVFNYFRFYLMLIIIFIILTIALMSSIKTNTGIALTFGIAAGCLGALDNILKRMSLREGLTGFLQWQNILIFIFSAILVIIAIILTQIGFFKGDSTSKQISAYNSFYIIMPIVIELIIFENASISVFKICAIILIILGVFFLSSSGTKKIIIPSNDQIKSAVQSYVNDMSIKIRRLTFFNTLKFIKKSLNLEGVDNTWDDEIWTLALKLSRPLCVNQTVKTIYFK